MSETVDLVTRSATVRPTTWNPETREVEVVFATSNRVRVFLPGIGAAFEELEIGAAAMDLSALRSGNAPVLDAHRQDRATAIIGRVVSATIQNGAAVARLQLSSADDVQPIGQRIADGTIRSVSVGYRVRKHQRIGEQDGIPVLRAVEWQPIEISLVAIPADPAATIRNGAGSAASSPTKESSMSTTTAPAADAGNAAVLADRARVAAIYDAADLARARGVANASEIARRAVADGWDVQRARGEMHAALVANDQSRGTPAPTAISAFGRSSDDPSLLIPALAEALACRAGAGQPNGRAREFMNETLPGMAARLLEAGGISTRGLSPSDIIARSMHTTSDFPALLTAAGDRLLAPAFEPAASGIRSLCRMRVANDFRQLSTIRFAGVDRLAEVREGGEVTRGTAFEATESYRVRTFARSVSISRQALVNDDLGAFDAMRAIGRAAATTEAEELLTLLTANSGAGPNLADGNPLFRTQRNNLAASAGAIDITNVSTGRAAMRSLQVDLNGVTIANTPRYLLVGPARETAAEQFVATITAPQTSNVNPFAGRLEVVVEPRLSGNAWYLFADPAEAAMFEMATLGATGGLPQVETFTGPDQLGVTLRVVHDFGIGAVSPIGGWRNPGA